MLGFIVAAIAGFVTPQLETPVGRPVAGFLSKFITLEDTETRLITFVVAMLGAAVVGNLLDSGSTFWMVLGGALGYFATRLIAAGRKELDARKNKVEAASETDDA